MVTATTFSTPCSHSSDGWIAHRLNGDTRPSWNPIVVS
jgi:hypothetical protein